MIDAVGSGQISFKEIESLPPRLCSPYELFFNFNRLFRDAWMYFQPAGLDAGSAGCGPLAPRSAANRRCYRLNAEKKKPPSEASE
jgi:hypothetical protein